MDFTKGHAREIAYDPDFHAYPITETIHIGDGSEPLVFQAAYDEGFGTVNSSTDFNGQSPPLRLRRLCPAHQHREARRHACVPNRRIRLRPRSCRCLRNQGW